jgi:hypothetical protein
LPIGLVEDDDRRLVDFDDVRDLRLSHVALQPLIRPDGAKAVPVLELLPQVQRASRERVPQLVA